MFGEDEGVAEWGDDDGGAKLELFGHARDDAEGDEGVGEKAHAFLVGGDEDVVTHPDRVVAELFCGEGDFGDMVYGRFGTVAEGW